MIVAGIYMITRMRKTDMFSMLRNRKICRGGTKGWFGWRREKIESLSDAPPRYSSENMPQQGNTGFASDEKSIPQQLSGFFSPIVKSKLIPPQAVANSSQPSMQNPSPPRETLLDHAAPFSVSQTPTQQQTTQSITQAFYTPSNYNPNNTYNTNATFLSRNTSDAYDPAQREVNHLSYLSSLSSGFGDQVIIPETGPLRPIVPALQQNTRQSRKFSWATSILHTRRQDDRDTVYTTTSVESAPRFRTINSWVAQQTGRVERQQRSEKEVPNMPEIPLPLQVGVARHRDRSEDLGSR
jgi:hypothetical protein